MLKPTRWAAAVVWCILLVGKWFQEELWIPLAEWWIDTVLGTWEESVKSIIRETFANVTRVVNGFFSWVVAALPNRKQLPRSLRTRLSRSQAWQSWWREERPSTFNAIIARDCPPNENGRSSGGLANGSASSRRGSAASTPRSTPPPTPGRTPRRSSTGSRKWPHDSQQPKRCSRLQWLRAPLTHLAAAIRWVPGGSWLVGAGRQQPEAGLRRRGSDLFDRPSGWAVSEGGRRRGFAEDMRLNCELAVTAVFDTVRWLVRCTLRVPQERESPAMRGLLGSVPPGPEAEPEEGASRTYRSQRLRRSASFSAYETLHGVWTAKDVIQSAGYPMEPHIVTTSDGYIMQMERIPRRGARDVVFFMHGILDTAMGWVCNGVTGSNAFAAYDAGFDVWLGNSRANPPRLHMDPAKQGARYWHYSINELGMEDIAAQIDHIHIIKTTELTAASLGPDGSIATRAAADALFRTMQRRPSLDRGSRKMRRSNSDTALDQRHVEGTTASEPYADPAVQPPNEASVRASVKIPRQEAAAEQDPKKSRQQAAQQNGQKQQSPDTAEPHTPRKSAAKKLFSGFLRRRGSRSSSGGNEAALKTPPNSARQAPRASQWASPQKPGAKSPQLPPRSSASRGGSASNGSATAGRSLVHAPPHRPQLNAVSAGPILSNGTSLGMSHRLSSHALPEEAAAEATQSDSDFGATPMGSPVRDSKHSSPESAVVSPRIPALRPSQQEQSSGAPVPALSFHAPPQGGPAEQQSPADSPQPAQAQRLDASPVDKAAVHGAKSAPGVNAAPERQQTAASNVRQRQQRQSQAQRQAATTFEAAAARAAAEVAAEEAGIAPHTPAAASRAGASQAGDVAAIPEAERPLSPPATTPELDALGPAESAKRLTPDRESAGGIETPSHENRKQRDQRRAAWAHRAGSGGTSRPSAPGSGLGPEKLPYRLRAVGHSLGGASLLIYAAMCGKTGRPHHLYRLILLTPAGFLKKTPWALWPFTKTIPPLARLVDWKWPGAGAAAYVPSSLLRYLTFKVFVDLQQIPALNELTLAGMRMLLNGDASQWDRALQMPHYNARAMPAISFHTGVHLIQWARSGRFTLFDYGSPARNMEHYGETQPPDVAGYYGLLDCPVDICAGRADGVIAKENVLLHYEAFQQEGARVTYKEFDFGHLDFTFAVKDELRHYVLSRLLLRN